MFASLKVKVESGVIVVCEFSNIFLDDIGDLPLEREVKFAIDLVPGTRHVSMAPYKGSNIAQGCIKLSDPHSLYLQITKHGEC